jgi:hypothetical protein
MTIVFLTDNLAVLFSLTNVQIASSEMWNLYILRLYQR